MWVSESAIRLCWLTSVHTSRFQFYPSLISIPIFIFYFLFISQPHVDALSFSVELHQMNSVSSLSAIVWILGTFPSDNLTLTGNSS